jgi:hypothetical protein
MPTRFYRRAASIKLEGVELVDSPAELPCGPPQATERSFRCSRLPKTNCGTVARMVCAETVVSGEASALCQLMHSEPRATDSTSMGSRAVVFRTVDLPAVPAASRIPLLPSISPQAERRRTRRTRG